MYSPPASTAVNFSFTTSGYAPPASTAVNFSWPISGSSGGGGSSAPAPGGIVAVLIGL